MTLPVDSAWTQLYVYILPLFNGEPLQVPMCVVTRIHTFFPLKNNEYE